MGTKKKGISAGNAWSVLRMALLWARKSAALNKKRLKSKAKFRSQRMHFLERQFSIDETPIFHLKMHRPASLRWISCANPSTVDFDDDGRNYFKWDENDVREIEEKCRVVDESEELVRKVDEEYEKEEEGIDSKAEDFIVKFYQQMKMQRQISFLQYNEMLERSA
ncbi:uncharacterized protein LOC109839896 [Asparagus officinalis]|uniref:uncharacterized protein LOC109839896 n=1 Tax=Asparagus officinalis TaxID=4686 RepID=UPI00098E2C38|nr:uncharacterized protein LOC109839896 [Asparagus officinalis]